MSVVAIGGLAAFSIIGLSFIGVPVGVAIALTAAAGMYLVSGPDFMLVMFQTIPLATAAEYSFVVVPTFILMGNIASVSGMIEAIFKSAAKWLSTTHGGLFYAVTVASAGFAAVSGSTVVNAAAFSRMALPHMRQLGYDKGLSAGCIAAAGTFAVMIPPSLGFVIYGILTEESVGRLFVAGLIPGIVTVLGYFLALKVLLRFKPDLAPQVDELISRRERLLSLRPLWSFGLLVIVILGGIYAGLFSPSAAGSIGATGAIVIALSQRRLTWKSFAESAVETAKLTASIFFIVIAGFIFARFLITSGFIPELVGVLTDVGIGKYQFLAILVVLYLVLGMFIDGASMAVITLPFVYPISQQLGIDGIWLGVLFVKMVEIGAITPPMGINLYAALAASQGQLKLTEIIQGVVPFVILELAILLLLILVPQLSLYLPSTMG
ncbi:TRAP transporter large permease [Pelagibius marinus]|uniref:TRAP transporter large permease n=1 Tax=Pelagibius marinus TaxID=2762760 RepID=UPI001873244D|nr:TRAP transporter large permease subunit [Pelagibius marinus]